MTLELINLFYVASAALFIFGLKQLGSPATAVRGEYAVLCRDVNRNCCNTDG